MDMKLKIEKFANRLRFFIRKISLKARGDVSFSVTFDKAENIQLGKNIVIKEYSKLLAKRGKLIIGDHCRIDRNVFISSHGGSITIGRDCSFRPNCVIYGHGGLVIGNKVRIATGVTIIPANHNFSRRDIPIADQGETKKGITIGDDVWIGAQCVILDGVNIGAGCVIGAGSIVTRSMPEYSIVAGNPARVIKKR